MRKLLFAPLFVVVAALLVSCGSNNNSATTTVPTQTAQKKSAFVYATDISGYNASGSTIAIETLQFDSNTGALSFVGSPLAIPELTTASAVMSADSSHLYVYGEATPCCASPRSLLVYSLDPRTGAPTLVQTFTSVGSKFGINLQVDPLGRFVYVSPWDETWSKVGVYAVQMDGTLNFNGVASAQTSGQTFISPNGKYLYTYTQQAVGNWIYTNAPSGPGLTTILQYAIDSSTGMLTPVTTTPAQFSQWLDIMGRYANNSIGLEFNLDGSQAFAVQFENGVVNGLTADASSGALKVSFSTPSRPYGTSFGGFSLDPNGRFLYTTPPEGVGGLVVPASGGPTPLPTFALTQNAQRDLSLTQPIVDAYGEFVVVDEIQFTGTGDYTGNDALLVFQINQSTGALTPVGNPVTLHGLNASIAMTQPH